MKFISTPAALEVDGGRAVADRCIIASTTGREALSQIDKKKQKEKTCLADTTPPAASQFQVGEMSPPPPVEGSDERARV